MVRWAAEDLQARSCGEEHHTPVSAISNSECAQRVTISAFWAWMGTSTHLRNAPRDALHDDLAAALHRGRISPSDDGWRGQAPQEQLCRREGEVSPFKSSDFGTGMPKG